MHSCSWPETMREYAEEKGKKTNKQTEARYGMEKGRKKGQRQIYGSI